MKTRLLVPLICLLLLGGLNAKTLQVSAFPYQASFTDLNPREAENLAVRRALEEIVMQHSGLSVTGYTSSHELESNTISRELFSKFITINTSGYIKAWKIVEGSKFLTINPDGVITLNFALDAVLEIPDKVEHYGLQASLNKTTFVNEELAVVSSKLSKPAYISLIAISERDSVYLLWSGTDKAKPNVSLQIPPKESDLEIPMIKEAPQIEMGAFCLIASEKQIFSAQVPPDVMHYEAFARILQTHKYEAVYLPYSIR